MSSGTCAARGPWPLLAGAKPARLGDLSDASPLRHEPQALMPFPVSRRAHMANSERSSEQALPYWWVQCRPAARGRLTIRHAARCNTKYEELTCGNVFKTKPPRCRASQATY